LGLATVFGLAAVAPAQGPLAQPGFVAGGPGALAGAGHAALGAPIASADAFVDAHGDPLVMPAQYSGPVAGGGCGGYGGECYAGEGYGGGYDNGCYGNGGGCFGGHGGAGGGCLAGLWGGGVNEQCGPHYFDFSAEYLRYTRDKTSYSESTVLSTNSFANDNNTIITTPFNDQFVALRAGGVDADQGDGYRLTGRIDVGALSVAEFVYSGMYWDDEAVANQQGQTQLFSVFSLYGTGTNGDWNVDGTAGAPTGPDFLATDNAMQHRLRYESELHTAEASFRRYWVGFSPRVSGTLLVGFRYTNLQEAMTFSSFSDTVNPIARNTIAIGADADNDLAGVQAGGDAWVTLLQGLRIGGESKFGLYNNNYRVRNSVAASDASINDVQTLMSGDQAAFMFEGKLMAVADLTPSWSLKAGYEFLFISDLATIGDSLATAQPYGDINNISHGLATALPPGVGPAVGANTDGEAFFHGFTIGAEYVW
jgi:hypothetical protein